MSKITLNTVGSLIDTTTSGQTINNNFSTVQTAFDNTLSRDGTTPNTMGASLDLNSNRILNLPAPVDVTEPARLTELNAVATNAGNMPAGGTTGQVLVKNSNNTYDTRWATAAVTSVGLSLPADFTITNSPVTSTGTLTGSWATTPTGSGAVVRATSPTLVSPSLGLATATSINKVALTAPATSATLTLTDGTTVTGPVLSGTIATLENNQTVTGIKAFTDGTLGLLGSSSGSTVLKANAAAGSTVMTLPAATDIIVGKSTTDILSNKTLVAPVLGAATGTSLALTGGDVSFATSGRGLVGTATNDNANAGNVGEYVSGSCITTSITASAVTSCASISLTAGDWDVWINAQYLGGATTNISYIQTCLSTSNSTTGSGLPGNITNLYYGGQTPFGTISHVDGNVGPIRVSLSGTTSYFFNVFAVFSVSTLTTTAILQARRRR